MTKFNKSLLTAAVVGALALPAVASAADLSYVAGKQISFAKDLIVNDGTTIYTANGLRLTAEGPDAVRLGTVAGDDVTVKVTLTNGARFDTTADAPTLVAGFLEGVQTGGAPVALGAGPTIVGTPYYSTSGQELNFTYTASGAGVLGAAGDYFLELNSLQITNLVQGLFNGSSVGAEITVQNSLGQQILASSATIATSKWGLAVSSDPTQGDTAATIDVGSSPRKTLFSSTGGVGVADATLFNAGELTVDIATAVPIGGGAETYINNYSAVAATPQYNIVATADITVTVTGTDLSAFDGGHVWLDQAAGCASGVDLAGTVSGDTATFTSNASDPLWASVTGAPPGPSSVYVCFEAHDDVELVAQELAGSVSVAYNLPTQRVDPPAAAFALLPLRLNGTTLYFQNVNPGDNPTAQSFLRLTNNNSQICPVTIDAKDDAGLLSDEVNLVLQPHASAQLNTTFLDSGSYPAGLVANTGATGALGDGSGKWFVRVTAECSNFWGSALNRNNETGTVTNLTHDEGVGNHWLTPGTKLNP
ncbi:hypothetical protein [Pseudoxanthomonas koreensis]|uniref:hypothetical protein n=1 Tax=Pseudoxanthomonas koreensis TaxID=266061 RepID=UPI0035A6FDF5